MARIFGFDIGTTSIGWAVIDHDAERLSGQVIGMGVRIFPEARDPKGVPFNQTRRQKRLVRRQVRRRRERRRDLNQALAEAGLLPRFQSGDWSRVMAENPWTLRERAARERLDAAELGRALYHLAKRRHFRGRDAEEGETAEASAEEKQAEDERSGFLAGLVRSKKTLGGYLAERPERTARRRGVHASRDAVRAEFEAIMTEQSKHHGATLTPALREALGEIVFAQRPVFWRKSTLGSCRLMPGAELCPKGAWLSQQRRMLEKLNNLEVAGGNRRPLDADERAAILERLQVQGAMSWPGVRVALAPLYAARGEKGMEKRIRFNLEVGGDKDLPGNRLEAQLAKIFGSAWEGLPRRQAIRDAAHERVRRAYYGEIGEQRVVIRPGKERMEGLARAQRELMEEFGLTSVQAGQVVELPLAAGWEPFSTAALEAMLPELERGVRFGELLASPAWEAWRAERFPGREQPTGEWVERLPSPAGRRRDGSKDPAGLEEQRRLDAIRNPTVVRTQNELRKVVNNLVGAYGKPDLIRVEIAREVGLSKREREEKQSGQKENERRREKAAKALLEAGIGAPSRDDVTKWLLWEECGRFCPYTGDAIGFDGLFRNGEFEVEHIWPRYLSLDDSQRNKTLCRKDVNAAKGNRIPSAFFQSRPEEWATVKDRLNRMMGGRGKGGMPPGKVKRFVAESMPEDFASRQLNDTSHTARQAVAQLKRLWPDVGPEAPVRVQVVTGRVTAELRRLWGLNGIVGANGEKTREDHRHHAIDALVVACTHPGMTQLLSRYWQARGEGSGAARPDLPAPWPGIRAEAEAVTRAIVVSHRVQRKVSGPLHEETIRGDTGEDVTEGRSTYRLVVSRKPVEALSKSVLQSEEAIVDPAVRRILREWVAAHGGDPKKAFATYPTVSPGGPPIKRVRIRERRQLSLMRRLRTDMRMRAKTTTWRSGATPRGRCLRRS